MTVFRVTVCEGSGVRAEEYAYWPSIDHFKPGYRLCAFCGRIVKNRRDTGVLARHKRLHHERVLAWEKYHFGKSPYESEHQKLKAANYIAGFIEEK